MYIFHWIVLDIIAYIINSNIFFKNSLFNLLTIILSGILMTYFIALISYRLEKFFINVGKKFS
jgi:peptidoglycan/LPS O-acetylase OafA/YrhL